MARTKRNKSNHRRKPLSRQLHSQLAKISSGEPTTIRRQRTDPPVLPTKVSQIVRARFEVSLKGKLDYKKPTTTITLPEDAFAMPTIEFDWPSKADDFKGDTTMREFHLTNFQIASAAYLRATGHAIKGDTSNARFAMKSAQVYGPTREHVGSVILRCQPESDLPGFIGTDAPGGRNRAFVGFTLPRLDWFVAYDQDTYSVLQVDYNSLTIPGTVTLANDQTISLGCCDVVVEVVRALKPSDTPVAKARRGRRSAMDM